MSSTTFKVNQEYFTVEMTEAFVRDLEAACQTMDVTVFTNLFIKFDLSFIDEYQEVLNSIKYIMSSWNKPGQGSVVLEVTPFDSKCVFCVIGKSVKGYIWTYQHKNAAPPMNGIIYENKMSFYLDFKNNRLTEFGVCNMFLNIEEMNLLNS